MHGGRHGAKQPERFDPARAALLNDTERFTYVPPDALLAELDAPHGSTLVDFGAGTGLYTIALARARPDLRIVALDEQPPMLAHLHDAIANARAENVEVAGPDAVASLRAHADRVLALNVLHELADDALDEVRALLAPGGGALFVDWNAAVDRPVGPPRDHVYAPDDAALRLTSHGFTVTPRPALRYHFVLAARAST